jgi:hypothetical protein
MSSNSCPRRVIYHLVPRLASGRLYNRRRLNSCIAYPASPELVKASSPRHEVRPYR